MHQSSVLLDHAVSRSAGVASTSISQPYTRKPRLGKCLAVAAGAERAGENILGKAIKQTYGIGQDSTIRWGVLKSNVTAPQRDGRPITWEEYRKQTEPERQKLRELFAERLEVISYEERDRRRLVGSIVAVLTLLAATVLVTSHAPWTQRLWLYPGVAFAIAYIDSAYQGLCTESLAGAWDVDDTGLEYMPNQQLAERIQQKVIQMYLRDGVISAGIMAALCLL